MVYKCRQLRLQNSLVIFFEGVPAVSSLAVDFWTIVAAIMHSLSDMARSILIPLAVENMSSVLYEGTLLPAIAI